MNQKMISLEIDKKLKISLVQSLTEKRYKADFVSDFVSKDETNWEEEELTTCPTVFTALDQSCWEEAWPQDQAPELEEVDLLALHQRDTFQQTCFL